MKKAVISAAVFAAIFILTYLALCYLVPGLRIKLEADPFTYFTESLQSMVLFKTAVSAAAGAVAAAAAALLPKLRQ